MADDFLYRHCESDGDGMPFLLAHRVIKKSATRVYVDREIYNPAVAYQNTDIKTFVLDRATLERYGHATGQRRRGLLQTFYTTPA